jgi:replicative DNA helicase
MTNHLPSSPEAERTVLGSMLLDSKHLDGARLAVKEPDFSLDGHQRIFSAMCRLDDTDRAVDIVTLMQALQDSKELQACGGAAYLAALTEGLPRTISIDDYTRIVKEKSRLRKVIKLAELATTQSLDQTDEAISIIGRVQDNIQAILDDTDCDNPHVSAYSVETLDKFEQDRRLQRSTGLSYGLAKLDEMTGGMRPGEVVIVGARSGVGKTSLACQVIVANCMVGIPVHFFSLEMTRAKILHRLWSIVSGVAFARIRRPWLANIDDAARVRLAAAEVAEWPLRIHDQSEMHLSQIVAASRISIRRHGSRLVIVDYAQEVNADGKDERTKTMATARGLTRMIKHEPASLMLLSQLVKGNRESYNKPPVISDLIESGKLENVAHVAILLHRGWDEAASKISEDAEILIPKQRDGDTGAIAARFNRRTVTFEETNA